MKKRTVRIGQPVLTEKHRLFLNIKRPAKARLEHAGGFFDFCYSSSLNFLPMRTPMTEAIIRPLVQPLESPKQ